MLSCQCTFVEPRSSYGAPSMISKSTVAPGSIASTPPDAPPTMTPAPSR
jgi:hypothetical protein